MTTRLGDIHLRNYRVGPGMIFIWIVGALGLGVAAYRWIYGLRRDHKPKRYARLGYLDQL